jgi:hypothetical protein
MRLYKNGTAIASGSSYTPDNSITSWILSAGAGGGVVGSGMIYRDVAVFDRALTLAQITADYTQVAGVLADGDTPGQIPTIWTVAADDELDGWTDSNEYNYGPAFGIPGRRAALSFQGAITGYGAATPYGAHFSNTPVDPAQFIAPATSYPLFKDFSGTVVAGRCGGEVQTLSAIASAQTMDITSGETAYNYLAGRLVYGVAGLSTAAAGTLQIQLEARYNNVTQRSEARTISCTTAYKIYRTGAVVVAEQPAYPGSLGYTPTVDVNLIITPVSATPTVRLDYCGLSVEPLYLETQDADATMRVLLSHTRSGVFTDGNTYLEPADARGKLLWLEPGKYNLLTYLSGADQQASSSTPITITAMITPYYDLV